MSLFRTAMVVAAVSLAAAAWAEPTSAHSTSLGRALGLGQVAPTYEPYSPASSLMLGIRAGAMVHPRGAGVVGLDFGMPRVSVFENWEGRLDVDVIIKANFAGMNTIVPVTFDQIYTAPSGAGNGRSAYFGVGVGALMGGNTKWDGKLLAGADITSKIGAEVNFHVTERDSLLVLLARTRL